MSIRFGIKINEALPCNMQIRNLVAPVLGDGFEHGTYLFRCIVPDEVLGKFREENSFFFLSRRLITEVIIILFCFADHNPLIIAQSTLLTNCVEVSGGIV